MNRWPAWVGRALVLCVREHDWDAPPPGLVKVLKGRDLSLLVLAARQHHVEPCVSRSLALLEPTPVASAVLERATAAARLHQLRARADLLRLAGILTEQGTPWLVVKGPYLSEVVYSRPGLRNYLDLDLLVPRRTFASVVQNLVPRGYALPEKDWSLASAQLAGELELRSPYGTPVDLHWEVLYHDSLRSSFQLSTEEIFERAREVVIEGTPVPVPDLIDTLTHLCIHSFREGGLRLQWLKDIEQTVLHEPTDWDELVRRARDRRVALVVGGMLRRSHAVLGTPVPEQVLQSLVPRSWSRLAAGADRIAPPQRSIGHRSVASLVTRATRATPARSLACLAAESVRRTRQLRDRPGPPATGPASRGEVNEFLRTIGSGPPVEPVR